jgi:hypothetical protein
VDCLTTLIAVSDFALVGAPTILGAIYNLTSVEETWGVSISKIHKQLKKQKKS